MNLNLNAPPQFNGDIREQMQQVQRYLFQLQRDLNIALDSVASKDGPALVSAAQDAVKSLSDVTMANTAKTLKSLIIKTANTIQKEMDSWTTLLEGNYLALSDFGTYREEVSQEITATATEIVNRFTYESNLIARIAQLETENTALKTYKVETEQYTKSGLLYYDEYDVPVYGYAVGEVLKGASLTNLPPDTLS